MTWPKPMWGTTPHCMYQLHTLVLIYTAAERNFHHCHLPLSLSLCAMAYNFYSAASQGQDHSATFNTFRPQQPHPLNPIAQSSDTATAMLIDGEEELDQEVQEDDHHRISRAEHNDTPSSSSSSQAKNNRNEASSSSSSSKAKNKDEEGNRKRELSIIPKLDALCCPICMEPWGSQGVHQVCCLPCGHVYGMSCISRWIQKPSGYYARCPICNARCTMQDVRKLYASPVVVNDEDLKKKIKSLEAEIGSFKTERAHLLDTQDNLLKVQENLLKALHQLKEKPTCLENAPLGELGRKPFEFITAKDAEEVQSGGYFRSNFGGRGILHCNFVLEHELAVEGARLFDMDVSYQVLILARRISGMGGTHMLNKINLIYPHENEDIQLPPSTKAIKDLRVSPCGRLALLASLGKKLSILSMGSNDVVTSYDLPGQAWSCSWDHNSPHIIYAGLQNGMLLVFDMRQTINPLQSLDGATSRPIHTIHSLMHNPSLCHGGARKLLTASSAGPCVWNTSGGRESPFMVPGLENQGICMSLAYGPSSDDIVASYCPKIQTPNGTVSSQSSQSYSPTIFGQRILGSQVLVKRVAGSFYHNLGSASAHLSDVHITKSAVINVDNCFPLFAYGDEVTHGLRLRELPSLTFSQNLKPHQHPILDVKYAHSQGSDLLGCISEDKLQLFSSKVL